MKMEGTDFSASKVIKGKLLDHCPWCETQIKNPRAPGTVMYCLQGFAIGYRGKSTMQLFRGYYGILVM